METAANKDRFYIWLNEVRLILISLTILAYKDRKPYRQTLFNDNLVLDEKSWRSYFDERYTPRKAVKEDLELPWIVFTPHTILL